MSVNSINYAAMFNQNYENALKSYRTTNQNTTQSTQQIKNNTKPDIVSFKGNNINNPEKPQQEKKSKGVLKGIAIGAAVTGVAAWLLTRGKVKPSAVMKTPKVFKTNGNIKYDHLTSYANAAKNEYGTAIDKIIFVKGDKYSEFLKNNGCTMISEEDKVLSLLGKTDIIAIAEKEGNHVFKDIFMSSGLDKDVVAAFKGEPILGITL